LKIDATQEASRKNDPYKKRGRGPLREGPLRSQGSIEELKCYQERERGRPLSARKRERRHTSGRALRQRRYILSEKLGVRRVGD